MWQEIIVGLCVLGALVFLVRRWLPGTNQKNGGCGSGCGSCTTRCNTKTEPDQKTDRP